MANHKEISHSMNQSTPGDRTAMFDITITEEMVIRQLHVTNKQSLVLTKHNEDTYAIGIIDTNKFPSKLSHVDITQNEFRADTYYLRRAAFNGAQAFSTFG
jgi:hypothetical protein